MGREKIPQLFANRNCLLELLVERYNRKDCTSCQVHVVEGIRKGAIPVECKNHFVELL